MPSAKIYIPNRIYKNGTTPIFIQFIVECRKFKKQVCAVEPEYIDRKNKEVKSKHPNSARLNQLIHKRLSAAKTYILDCDYNDELCSPPVFFQQVKTGTDLISYLKAREDLFRKQGLTRRADTFKVVAAKVTAAGLPIKISQIDTAWIDKLNTYMINSQIGPGTRGLYFSALNVIFKRLIGQGILKSNPMIDFKLPAGKGTKEKYTLQEFNHIRSIPLDGMIHYARQMFVFATLARGMRAADVLTLRRDNIRDGRLRYKAQKSKKDFDIEVTPAMTACLEGLPDNKGYVWPFVKLPPVSAPASTSEAAMKAYIKAREAYQRHVTSKNTQVNQTYLKRLEGLSGINKHLTMHVARHTFSDIMRKNKVDLLLIRDFLGHSDVKTTKAYTDDLSRTEDLDEGVRWVF